MNRQEKRPTARTRLIWAMEKLLRAKNLEDISVMQIVDEAGVCRKTFYRNFIDKYDLADQCFAQFLDESFGMITSGEDWDSALLKYLELCESKADMLRHAYSSMDVNGMRESDIKSTRKTYEKYLVAKGADISTVEMEFAIEIASRGGTDMVIKWIMNGMKEERFLLKELIKRTLPKDLLKYLE